MSMDKLIKKAQQGNREAMRSILLAYRQLIEGVVMKFIWNREFSEDAIQNVCLKVIRGIGTYEGNCRLSTWLYRISVNECMQFNRLKTRGKKMTAFVETDMDVFPDPDAPDGFTSVDRREMATVLGECMEHLPDGMRKACELYYVDQRSGSEAAGKLNITTEAFFVRLSAARARLRRELIRKGIAV
jgi:RNA polymerase sigma-70 factor, ECF subfamily